MLVPAAVGGWRRGAGAASRPEPIVGPNAATHCVPPSHLIRCSTVPMHTVPAVRQGIKEKWLHYQYFRQGSLAGYVHAGRSVHSAAGCA